MSEQYKLIGQRLRAARDESRVSRRQVVEMMRRRGYRISVSSLQDFEEGKRLNLNALLQLAEVLGRHPGTLMGMTPSRDLNLDEIEYLIDKSTQVAPWEKEFLYAGIFHIHLLRERGAQPAAAAPKPEQLEPTPANVRAALLQFLGHGGAFSLKELAARPPFDSVAETLLHHAAQELRRERVIRAVTHRPTRYCLVDLEQSAQAEQQ